MTHRSSLRRPASLIAAARIVARSLRESADDLTRIEEREALLDIARRAGDAAYSPLAHVTALARLLAARRTLC